MARYVLKVTSKSMGAVNRQRALMLSSRSTVRDAYKRAAFESVGWLRVRTKEEKKVDLGGFLRGWFAQVMTVAGGDVSTVISNMAPHARYVEDGRRPGKMPPVAKIAAWAGRKMGRPDLGFVIARAIGRRGIGPTPILKSEDFKVRIREIVRREVQRGMDRVAKAAVGRARGI